MEKRIRRIVCVASLLVCWLLGTVPSAFAAEEKPAGGTSAGSAQEPQELGSDQWPTTVDAVVVDILAGMSEQGKETLRHTKREDLIRFHHGWGTGIRNHYGLWRGNKELLHSACGKEPCRPDTASMIIIERVWEAVQDANDKQAEQRSSL
jgi:hypothetical protein